MENPIPTVERLPNHGDIVLVWDAAFSQWTKARFDSDGGHPAFCGVGTVYPVASAFRFTHWLPFVDGERRLA